jgi:hypothetical protein
MPALSDPESRLGNYSVTLTNGTLAIGQASVNISLSTSTTALMLNNSVTLTATAKSATTGTPAGSVSFADGETSLGSAQLSSSGVATLSLSTLTVGKHAITATYGGDADFQAMSEPSSAVGVTVEDFQFSNLSGGSLQVLSSTVQPGGVATFVLALTPDGGGSFPANIALSLSGLPSGATYTISPANISAGSRATKVTVTVQTAPLNSRRQSAPGYLLAALMPLAGVLWLRQRRKRWMPVLLLLALAIALFACGCGGGNNGFFAEKPASYSLTLTGTSGSLSHTMNLDLTVE